MNKMVIMGGGGHAKVLIDLIQASGAFEISGILDPALTRGLLVSGVPVIGGDDLLDGLHARGIMHVCIGIGSIRDNNRRKMLYERVKRLNFCLPALSHPLSVISKGAKVAGGVQVMASAIIQADTVVDENTIVNTGAIVEHDCSVGSHVHVCPGAVVSGGCIIGDGSFIGAGATLIQGIRIGRNALIAAGAVVIEDVPDGATVKGVPAR